MKAYTLYQQLVILNNCNCAIDLMYVTEILELNQTLDALFYKTYDNLMSKFLLSNKIEQ